MYISTFPSPEVENFHMKIYYPAGDRTLVNCTVLNMINVLFLRKWYFTVHRCGAGGSKHACHAVSLGSIPDRDKFPGWGFLGFFSHLKDKCQEALGPQGPWISFDYHNHHSSFITGANDLRCQCALNPQIYIQNINNEITKDKGKGYIVYQVKKLKWNSVHHFVNNRPFNQTCFNIWIWQFVLLKGQWIFKYYSTHYYFHMNTIPEFWVTMWMLLSLFNSIHSRVYNTSWDKYTYE